MPAAKRDDPPEFRLRGQAMRVKVEIYGPYPTSPHLHPNGQRQRPLLFLIKSERAKPTPTSPQREKTLPFWKPRIANDLG